MQVLPESLVLDLSLMLDHVKYYVYHLKYNHKLSQLPSFHMLLLALFGYNRPSPDLNLIELGISIQQSEFYDVNATNGGIVNIPNNWVSNDYLDEVTVHIEFSTNRILSILIITTTIFDYV